MKYYVALLISLALYIGGMTWATLNITRVKHTYIVGFDECHKLATNYGIVTITDCASGLTYINPATYREIKE